MLSKSVGLFDSLSAAYDRELLSCTWCTLLCAVLLPAAVAMGRGGSVYELTLKTLDVWGLEL